MEKEIRKKLCDVCLKMVRKTEAKKQQQRRLKLKVENNKIKNKIK